MSIKARGLVKYYGKRKVVSGVDLDLELGEIVGLLGPNGAGKTTTFYILTGLIKPKEGTITLDNKNITGYPIYKRARMGLCYLPQEPSVFRKLTVKDNVKAILEFQHLTRKEMDYRADKLISELNLTHIAKQKAFTLSGGERRKVEICRALSANPKYLLLDEPFAAIDPKTVQELQEIISELKTKGLGIFITDHNVREVLSITDRAYIIYEGKVLLSGSSETLQSDQRAKEIYLGARFNMN